LLYNIKPIVLSVQPAELSSSGVVFINLSFNSDCQKKLDGFNNRGPLEKTFLHFSAGMLSISDVLSGQWCGAALKSLTDSCIVLQLHI